MTGSGTTVLLSVTAALLMALGAGSVGASQRMAPARARLSKRYLRSLEKVFGEALE